MPEIIVTAKMLPKALRKKFREIERKLRQAAIETAHRGE